MASEDDGANQPHQNEGGRDHDKGKQKKPAWNTNAASSSSAPLNTPDVMGAKSWPLLSDSAKASSKASSSHSAEQTPRTQAPAPSNQQPDPRPILAANPPPPPVGPFHPGIQNNIASTSTAPFNQPPLPVPYGVPRGALYPPRPIFAEFPGPMDPHAVGDYLAFPRGNMGHRPNAFGLPNGNVHQRPIHRPPLMNPSAYLPPPIRPFPTEYYYYPQFPIDTYVAPVTSSAFDSSLPIMIRNQVEYYFSDENLVNDDFLKDQMDNEGWVSIARIASFNRVRSMTSNLQLVIESLKNSTQLEVRDDSLVRKRNNWMRWVLNRGSTSGSQNGA